MRWRWLCCTSGHWRLVHWGVQQYHNLHRRDNLKCQIITCDLRGHGLILGQDISTSYSPCVLTRSISSAMVFAADIRAQQVSIKTHDKSHEKETHSKFVTICHDLKPNEVKCRLTPSTTIQGTNTVIVICALRLKPRTRGFPVMWVNSFWKTLQLVEHSIDFTCYIRSTWECRSLNLLIPLSRVLSEKLTAGLRLDFCGPNGSLLCS
jgi:hypothetical protein